MACLWAVVALFNVLVNIVAANPCTGGGVRISGASSGFVSSPNFPNNFNAGQTCIWTITVPSGRIKLTFLNFTLEPNQNTDCSGPNVGGASISITNIASNDGRIPFKLCGQNIPAPVYSDSNSIQITLKTHINELPGFNASYEKITGEMLCPSAMNLTGMSGVITSPFYPRRYPVNQDCSWEIIASQGNYVKLEIADLQIHRCGQEGACTCDYLEILHGFLGSSLKPGAASGKICVENRFTPQTYYSTNERLRVKFHADDHLPKQQRGFTATYTLLNYSPPECPSAPVQLSGNGSFSSPNFPKANYPSGRNCFWIITASVGKRVKVEIKDFHMGTCSDCSDRFCSSVELLDGSTAQSPNLGRFCTGSTLTPKISNGRHMYVKFYSSFSPDRGFRAEYSETTDEPSPAITPPPTTPPPPTTSIPPTSSLPPTSSFPPKTTAKPPTTGAAAISITLFLVVLPSFLATMFSP